MKDKLQEEARAKYGLTPEQIVEAEKQLDELTASMKRTGSGAFDGEGPADAAPSLGEPSAFFFASLPLSSYADLGLL